MRSHGNPVSEPVSVPPALAGPLLRVLVRALHREAREDGGQVPPGIGDFLGALYAASLTVSPDQAANGLAEDAPDKIESVTGMLTVAQLAEDSGWSPRALRRWAAGGRVRAVRAGRAWLIDPESLREGWRERTVPPDRQPAA